MDPLAANQSAWGRICASKGKIATFSLLVALVITAALAILIRRGPPTSGPIKWVVLIVPPVGLELLIVGLFCAKIARTPIAVAAPPPPPKTNMELLKEIVPIKLHFLFEVPPYSGCNEFPAPIADVMLHVQERLASPSPVLDPIEDQWLMGVPMQYRSFIHHIYITEGAQEKAALKAAVVVAFPPPPPVARELTKKEAMQDILPESLHFLFEINPFSRCNELNDLEFQTLAQTAVELLNQQQVLAKNVDDEGAEMVAYEDYWLVNIPEKFHKLLYEVHSQLSQFPEERAMLKGFTATVFLPPPDKNAPPPPADPDDASPPDDPDTPPPAYSPPDGE